MERGKIERFIESARVQLGEKEADTVKALVDTIADTTMTRTSHPRTTAAFAGGALMSLAVGAAAGTPLSDGRPPQSSDMWEQCLRTARKDPSTGDVYCAMRLPRRP